MVKFTLEAVVPGHNSAAALMELANILRRAAVSLEHGTVTDDAYNHDTRARYAFVTIEEEDY